MSNKPVNMQLREKFAAFLESHGYRLTTDADEDGKAYMTISFPDGDLLSDEGGFDSKVKFEFDQEGYDEYVRNAKLSGFDQREIDNARFDFWRAK